MLETLIKRSGEREAFENSKANGWMLWAGKDVLDRMDWSSIILGARSSAPSEMTTQEWQMHLINRLKARGSQDDGWPYMLMAGRLYTIYLMKKIHGGEYPSLKDQYKKMVALDLMRDMGYSDEDLDYLGKLIDHDRNLELAWSQVEQYNHRYGLKDHVTKESFETPQFTIMRMAMAVFEGYEGVARLAGVQFQFKALVDDICNPPSPNYAALGTRHFGMASCCLFDATDDAQSIKIAGNIGYDFTLQSGGLGVNLSTRGPGDPVDGGRVMHGGRLNYIRKLVADTAANKQGARGGAINVYDTIYSPEAELSAMMQNPRTPQELRERRMNVTYMTNPFFSRKAARGEMYFTFTEYSAPDLYQAFFKADQTEFETLYARYEADPTFKKDYRKAIDTLCMFMMQECEVSTVFWCNPSELNRHSSFKGLIYHSNLCVAPETEVLTDQGHFPIHSLENKEVNVWNGQEFSSTVIRRTSEDSELLKISFDNGLELECTPEHKFYIQTGYSRGQVQEVRAKNLQPGMALIKMKAPVISGVRRLDKAYINGFYTGDGCQVGDKQRVYLYGEKRKLRNEFIDSGRWITQDKYDREYTHYEDLHAKYFVPLSNYTVDSRLEWLAGLLDSDGAVSRNGDNQSLQIASTNKQFLRDVLLMLQTLGVQARISETTGAGEQSMPDGRGGYRLYQCAALDRLLINSTDTQALLQLGLDLRRLRINKHSPNRNASHFVRVTEVKETGRRDMTFCFTEHKRHMGVFNGLLTGQCMEISVPTRPWLNMLHLYDPKGDPKNGEVGICNIGSIPVHRLPFNPANPKEGFAEYKRAVRAMFNIIDYAIENSEYHYPAIRTQARSRRNAAVGMSGIATLMAQLNERFDTREGRKIIHQLSERHMFACIEVALEMGIERGNAPWINGPNNDGENGTKWVDGWMPIDTYKKTVDDYVDSTLYFDWEDLRSRVVANKGIRFSSLVAHMPGEQATRKGNGSNSIYPLFALSVDLTDGSSAMPWAALDNDLIGNQYQMAFDMSYESQMVHYGIIQKFTDQAGSYDEYIDRRGGSTISQKTFMQNHLLRVKLGLPTKYYTRSLTEQEGKQKDIPTGHPTCPADGAMIDASALSLHDAGTATYDDGEVAATKTIEVYTTNLMDRLAAQARAMQEQGEGASCTLDGACGA